MVEQGLLEKASSRCRSDERLRDHDAVHSLSYLAAARHFLPAAKIAKRAQKKGTSLKDAALALGYLNSEEFDQWVRAEDMTRP
jgi:fumarate hydratase class II